MKENDLKEEFLKFSDTLPATFHFSEIQYFEKGIIEGNDKEGEGFVVSVKYQTPISRSTHFPKHISRMIDLAGIEKE